MYDDRPAERRAPVIVVASARGRTADEVASQLRRDGAIAVAAHSANGCLRVATSVGPDVVLLDSDLPRRLERLLRAHPVSARAQVVHMQGAAVPVGMRLAASLAG